MYSVDSTAFNAVLDDLGVVFGKPVSDEMRASYWSALKDLPIGLVVAKAETHKRFGKFFPKPFELRPKDDQPKANARDDAAFKAAEQRSIDTLEYLRKHDPPKWLATVSPKVYEMGRARGMPDGLIAHKLQEALARP